MRKQRINRLVAVAAALCAITIESPALGAQAAQAARVTAVRGGGPVIQVLPGPDAMADSAAAVIGKAAPEKQQMLKMLAMNGPFSDDAARAIPLPRLRLSRRRMGRIGVR